MTMIAFIDNGSQNVVPKKVRIESDGYKTLLYLDGALVEGAVDITFSHGRGMYATLKVEYALSPDLP